MCVCVWAVYGMHMPPAAHSTDPLPPLQFGKHTVYVSYFEIYGGRCQDLLNARQRLQVREDGSGGACVGRTCM